MVYQYYVSSVESLLSPVVSRRRHLPPKGPGDRLLGAVQMTSGSLSYPAISVIFIGTSIASTLHFPAYRPSTKDGCVQITQIESWYGPSLSVHSKPMD